MTRFKQKPITNPYSHSLSQKHSLKEIHKIKRNKQRLQFIYRILPRFFSIGFDRYLTCTFSFPEQIENRLIAC